MNGISLLLVLSSIGVTASVETDAVGQSVYTIRIESILINELRNGQTTIPIVVAPKDRRIRHFKIAVSDANVRSGSTSRASDINSGFDYEPTQYENGEIEYVVQISPERLESLVKGKPIEGDIAPDLPGGEVHRFLIFVGVGNLPSQQQAAAAQTSNVALAANGNPPSLLQGPEIRANPSTPPRTAATATTTQPTRTQFQTAPQTSTTRGIQTNDPLTQFNTGTRAGDSRTWRNQPDQSTISPPPFATANQNQGTNSAFPRGAGVSATNNQYANQPQYNNTYPQQPIYPDQNPAYAQSNPANYPQQGYPVNTTIPYPQQQQPPIATVAARNDLPPTNTNPSMPNTGWQQPPSVTQPVAQPTATTTPSATSSTKVDVEKDRPWTPLILTTLALFASLGTNAYLGWLSWSFFWRFRDAVTESARTRAQISTSRQAA